MSNLSDLYQELILDHNAKPRNFGKLAGATAHCEGYNPLCGDRLTVYVTMQDDRVADIRFDGSGCAISKASASLMTTSLKGKTRAEAEALFQRFHDLLTVDTAVPPEELGKLAVFAGVREFPMRVKCATLSWHTARGAITGEGAGATSE
jgi:nitrogen fixation protein NifU and related proteins